MPSHPATRLLRVAIPLLAAFAVVTALAIGVTTAIQPACRSCHMSGAFAEETNKSPHSSISCARCHAGATLATRTTFASRQLFGMVLRLSPPRDRATAAVPDSTCLSCHPDVMDRISDKGDVSVRHNTCAEDSLCSDCHSETAHGSEASWQRAVEMDMCVWCHSEKRAPRRCDTCHADTEEAKRTGPGALAKTHGANWQSTHGMGNWETCSACHTKQQCANCHDIPLPHLPEYLPSHAAESVLAPQACPTCHDDSFCDGCHSTPMPHAAGFTPSHPDVVDKDGRDGCLVCHVESDCENCHIRHVHPGGAREASRVSR